MTARTSGCGTGEHCRHCGALAAVSSAQRGTPAVKACHIGRRAGGDALDLRVHAAPLEAGGESFTVLALTDISGEKRRRALERIFFHDVLNTAGAMMGYVELLRSFGAEHREQAVDALARLSHRLIDEIRTQRTLAQAERGTLELSRRTVEVDSILGDMRLTFEGHPAAEGKALVVQGPEEPLTLETDPAVLGRVLVNMVQNALEAAETGETVTLRCARTAGGEVQFSVHGRAPMSRETQLQVFKRSFSTKGAGRGLGTYSMKLLGERYLGGRVTFASSEERGTTFFATFPR